jgi:hypothetical protein
MCCAALFGKEGKHEEKTGGSVVRVPAGGWERCVEWTLARWIVECGESEYGFAVLEGYWLDDQVYFAQKVKPWPVGWK